MEALFDVHVVATDAQSHADISSDQVLENAEKEKRRKYLKPCEVRQAFVTPIPTSADGMLGQEFEIPIKTINERLSEKLHKP